MTNIKQKAPPRNPLVVGSTSSIDHSVLLGLQKVSECFTFDLTTLSLVYN